MNLQGKRVKLGIIKIGAEATEINSCLYHLCLKDANGKFHSIEAFGIERISSPIEPVNTDEIARMFKMDKESIARPQDGEVDLLLGMQYAALHPVRTKSIGNLLLMENQFGKVIAGSHPLLQNCSYITQSCMQARTALVMHASRIETFFEIEGLGVMCNPRCGGCKCGKCQLGGKNMTLREEMEYKMIDEGLSFDTDKGKWKANYPWIRSPEELPNNRYVALAILKSLERRLATNEILSTLYSQQMNDMVTRNAAREIDDRELSSYSGAKFYITHHAVFKPSSKSTPCRIVFNSSARHLGHSLNEYLAKGPSLLNNLLGTLLRFREGRHAFIGDISKMFHSIDIGIQDQMTHLYLWRNCNTESEPRTFAMTAVNMGDRPSATIAQVALQKTAKSAENQYPEAAKIIIENSYMDDILNSTNCKQKSQRLMNEIETILSSKGFRIKEWVSSEESAIDDVSLSQEAVKSLMKVDGAENAESVLGVRWKPDLDKLYFKVNSPPTSNHTTKRKVLSTINKIYDPIGLLAPFTVKMKILMRKIWANEPKIDWDEPLTQSLLEEWNRLLMQIAGIDKLTFQRSLTPPIQCHEPKLILFSDGSQHAYGAVAYVLWKTGDKTHANLIVSKTRTAPLKVIDIVKLELCGALLSKRLRETIEDEIRMEFTEVKHIVDSEIVHAMVKKQSYGFNTFTANRVGEIQGSTKPEEWYWVSGKPWLNVADMTTRGCFPEEINENSLWQRGPDFFALPEDKWPTRQDVRSTVKIPETFIKKFAGVASGQALETITNRIELHRFSKWRILVRATARILLLYQRYKRPPTTTSKDPSSQDIHDAEVMLIKQAQRSLHTMTCKKLNPILEDGVIMVGGRTERWMQATWNRQKFILLPKNHRISELIARYEHGAGGHLGVESTIAKIRSKYWIIGIRILVRRLVRNCTLCIRKRLQTCSQVMSPLPVERLRPSPPFAHVGIDYFGPFQIKGEVQKRVRGKCYGIIITCFSSRAVYIDVARDYSTDGFLEVFRRFACIRGWPKSAYSDNGTMLVAASNELRSIIKNLDWEAIKRHGSEFSIEWSFPPADAPWYNGATEALIKTTKRALTASIGENVLSFSEFQTAMFEAGQLVNQRPIGRLPNNPEEGTYLCPNDLILGRASSTIPQGEFKARSSLKHRLDFIQSLVNTFWKRWTREVFPNLVIQPKWHTESRNLQKGDIVLVQDSNLVRGQWKLALVERTELSKDLLVRKVAVSYRTAAGTRQEIERPVQRLILLVPVDGVGAECSEM